VLETTSIRSMAYDCDVLYELCWKGSSGAAGSVSLERLRRFSNHGGSIQTHFGHPSS
jgi:hypothetical protein